MFHSLERLLSSGIRVLARGTAARHGRRAEAPRAAAMVEPLEPRLLLSGSIVVDAGPDVEAPEGQSIQFAGSFTAEGGGGGRTVTQVTSDTFDDRQLQIGAAGAVWVGGAGNDVFFYNGSTVLNLSNTPQSAEYTPQIDGHYVVWQGSAGLYLYDTVAGGPAALIPGSADGQAPQISGNYVVWTAQPGYSYRVYAYDIAAHATRMLDNSGGNQMDPSVSGNKVVWTASGVGGATDIFLCDLAGGAPVNISNRPGADGSPRISGDYVAWAGHDGTDNDIFLYDGHTVAQLTSNALSDFNPQVWGNHVAWSADTIANDSYSREVFYYDGAATRRITNNTTADWVNALAGDYVVWAAQADGGSYTADVWCYDAATGSIAQVNPANGYEDFQPVVNSGGTVAWRGRVGGQSATCEIFYAGPQYAIAWNFGDGSGATGTLSPTHTYADDGAYVVTLTVSDAVNGPVSDTLAATVRNVAPTAAITGAPAPADEGTPIALGSVVTDPGIRDTFTYAWEVFRDGTPTPYATGDGAAFAFTPDDNGVYAVSLTVTDDDGGAGAASATTAVLNVAPTAAITGAPTQVDEGTAIALASVVTDPGAADTFTYAWQVLKDGAPTPYATGSGAAFAFTPDDNGVYAVSLTVTDDDGGAGAAGTSVTVLNVAPVVGPISGPTQGVRGQTLSFAGTFLDPGALDTHTTAWQVTNGGGQVLATGTGSTLEFTPTQPGSLTVLFAVTDDDGGSGSASLGVTVSAAAVLPDPDNPGQAALFVGGTSGDDKIDVHRGTGPGTVEVTIDNQSVGVFAYDDPSGLTITRIVVFGGDGDDDIRVHNDADPIRVALFGGAGDDRLRGGALDDYLSGGDGNDFLVGNDGRDVLVGGAGEDKIIGDADDDILIGGHWIEDSNLAAVRGVMAEWTRTDLGYAARVANLQTGGGLSRGYALNAATVFDDGVRDTLYGKQGLDWFFGNADEDKTDMRLEEILTDIELDFITLP